MPDKGNVTRLPRGSECQCMADGCWLFFSGESAFNRHWTKNGHVHPSEAGLVERQRAAGPVWGRAGENPSIADRRAQEGRKMAPDAPSQQ